MSSRNPYLVNRAFRTFAVSTILAVMATSMGFFINGVIVGNMMGAQALSAVNLVSPLVQLFNAITALLCAGGATLCAVLIGKGKGKDTWGVFRSAMVIMGVISAAMMVVGLFAPDIVASAICSSEALLPMVEEYASIALIGSAAYLFMPGLAMFVRVDGSPNTATLALGTANIMAPLLCVALVGSGFGIAGASAALVLGYAIGTVILVLHFLRNRSTSLFKPSSGAPGHIPELLEYGAPIALASVMMVIKMLVMNMLTLQYLGDAGMATMALAMNTLMLASMLIGGICQTIQPIGGTLYGSGDSEGISYLTRTVAVVLVASLSILVVVVMAVPGLFCTLFGVTDPEIVDSSITALRLFAPCILLYGVNYAIMVLYQVLGHRRISIMVSVVQPLCVIVTAFVLAPVDGELIWASFWIGELVMLVVVALMSAVMRRRDSNLIGLLLGRVPSVPIESVSFSGDGSDIPSALETVSSFLAEHGVDAAKASHIRLCCEELAVNVVEHGISRNPNRFADMVVRIGDEVSVIIRDDGALFNPIEYDGEGIGIMIAKGVCKDMTYTRAMGQNNVRVTF